MSDSNISMRFVQRRIGMRHSFVLNEDGFTYLFKNYSGERKLDVLYESINVKQFGSFTLISTPLYIRSFGLTLLTLLYAALSAIFSPFLSSFFILISLLLGGFALVLRFNPSSHIRFRVLQLQPPPPGSQGVPVRIIEDSSGDEIYAAILAARKSSLRRRYGEANLQADPEREIARLTWLKDNDVLNEQEWSVQVARVRSAQAQPSALLANERAH